MDIVERIKELRQMEEETATRVLATRNGLRALEDQLISIRGGIIELERLGDPCASCPSEIKGEETK